MVIMNADALDKRFTTLFITTVACIEYYAVNAFRVSDLQHG